MTNETELLSRMEYKHIVYALILIKKELYFFDRNALAYGLQKAADVYPHFKKTFAQDGLAGIIADMQNEKFLQDWSHRTDSYFITEYGKFQIDKQLKRYGTDVVETLNPLAEIVWANAKKYRHSTHFVRRRE